MPPLSPSNRCFPARSFMDGSWTTCPSQFVQHKQRCATADCAIGQIECRPMPAAQIEVEKINHMAVQQPIDDNAKQKSVRSRYFLSKCVIRSAAMRPMAVNIQRCQPFASARKLNAAPRL